jgi:hypothetical protein
MSTSAGVCSYIAVLNQQSETLHHQEQSNLFERPTGGHSQPEDAVNKQSRAPKNCTVVENGRVVVKPIS